MDLQYMMLTSVKQQNLTPFQPLLNENDFPFVYGQEDPASEIVGGQLFISSLLPECHGETPNFKQTSLFFLARKIKAK